MNIQYKLFSAFVLTGCSLVVLMFVLMQWSLSQGMLDFANKKEQQALQPFVEQIKLKYQQQGDWSWLNARQFSLLYTDNVDKDAQVSAPPPPPRAHKKGDRPLRPFLNKEERREGRKEDERRRKPSEHKRNRHHKHPPPHRGGPKPRHFGLTLLDGNKQWLEGKRQFDSKDTWLSVEIEQQVIAYLIVPKRHKLIEGYQINFLQEQQRSLLLIAAVLILLTGLLAFPLARHFVKPIRVLAKVLACLAQGKYASRSEIKRKDELGQLSRDVNELAMALEKNESTRKRWFADVSHELRTPIAILKGEIESVMDGIRPLTKASMESLEQEVKHLQNLVDDLYELSSADIGALKYRKAELDLLALLTVDQKQYQRRLTEVGMSLKMNLPKQLSLLWADETRLCQLFNNLLQNTCKYAGDNALLTITVVESAQGIAITFSDNGVGVADNELSFLFEHLYRTEQSRNRQTGGSGLGLAICKQIVEAHQGQIYASKTEGGGLQININLPK